MVPNTEKLMEVFIGGLPISIEGNVTASKPKTLEEAINITHRNTDNSNYPNDHNNNNHSNNRNNNNYSNDRNNNNHSNNRNNNNYQDNRNNYSRNNDYHQQQNRRQEIIRTYAATPTENKRVMSSPNHLTSNIEDAFSSNFPNYISASSNYVLASPGKNYSESSNNSFGLVPIASLTLLLFHDDPYMKVMHSYYAKKSPIPLPVIMPPSLMLSPMFDARDLFLPKDIVTPHEQAHFLLLSSTNISAQPQAIKIVENYDCALDTSHIRHEERIEDILNHLDELSLDHIEEMKGHVDGRVFI
nr:hypothetical protein [Tanacetum cinerariifolium]